ncbi:cysteine-rich receptor-like protein kinase [Tanacetum coccineum]
MDERTGSLFDQREANAFNNFISRVGLFDFPGGRLLVPSDIDKREEWLMDLHALNQLEREDLKQKIRVRRAVKGDENTRIFHLILRFFVSRIKLFYGIVTSKFVNGCNPSFTVLVPKKNDPLGFSDYRPISLIGCVYKIISKILIIRLDKIISSIIGLNQTAFLSGRQILDRCLNANEIIRMAKIEDHKLLLFKVDFEKSFDSVC